MKKFYDTNALLQLGEKAFENEFFVSSTTLQELEHIKTSKNKTEELRYKARKVTHLLDEQSDKYTVIIWETLKNPYSKVNGFEDNPDIRICDCAYEVRDRTVFVTNDICCRNIARSAYELQVEGVNETELVDYKGYKEVKLSEQEMAYLYEHMTENIYSLLTNEYLIIKDETEKVVDQMKWNGSELVPVKATSFKSDEFGTVKPFSGDIYQICAMDAISSNKLSLIKGKAGSGKSHLAIGYLFNMLEKHKIDKIILFANPTPTNNSAKIGFLPGTQFEKLLDSSVGNMLEGKIGDKYEIERLVRENKLSILPMCDIRGYDTSNQRAAIYITEAQNMDIDLMKLALQRIGDDCICILDGDYNCQVDLQSYAGDNNGMKRVSEVFRGQEFYGEVELQNVYRSKIAAIADLM